MKQTKHFLTIAMAIAMTFTLAGCKNTTEEKNADADTMQSTTEESVEEAVAATPTVSWQTVINDYLTNEIGQRFNLDNVLVIPSYTIIAADSSEGNIYRVWGDWWVGAYSDYKETLITSMEIAAPGLFVLQKTADGFRITKFEEVEEGRAVDENAQRIFGKYCDAFWKVNQDEDYRDSLRLATVSAYVHKHNLPYKKIQLNDTYPAVKLN